MSDTHLPAFSIDEHHEHDQVVFQVHGELDLETAPLLRRRLRTVIDAGHVDLVADLAELDFMDSTGISVLVDALKQVGRLDGRLVLRGVTPATYRVLEIAGLLDIFGVEPAS